MITYLPIKPEPSQRFSIVLDGQNCTIELYQRFDHLYVDLYVDDTPVTQGLVCLDHVAIPQLSTNLFKGLLFFLDSLGFEDPQWEGLGDRYKLIYCPVEDIIDDISS